LTFFVSCNCNTLSISIMARQIGIIQLSGPLGGISFYRHKKYGMLARACNPVSAQRIAQDPAFARTRENGTEFGMASRAGKLLRDGLRGFLQDVPTEELDLRVMRLMMDIKTQDAVSARGQRQVGVALGLQPKLLGGFEFNGACGLGRFLVRQPVMDVAEGTITLRDFPIAAAYASPPGWLDHVPKQATHVVVTGFRGRIDFGKGAQDFVYSEEVTVSVAITAVAPIVHRGAAGLHVESTFGLDPRIGALLPSGDLVLRFPEPAASVAVTGVELWGLKIVFLQEVNGVKYTLKIGAAGILESHVVPVVDIPEGISVRDAVAPIRASLPGRHMTAVATATHHGSSAVPAAAMRRRVKTTDFDPGTSPGRPHDKNRGIARDSGLPAEAGGSRRPWKQDST
jgi:hypothetical protein